MKAPRILYFIHGPMPTAAQAVEAESLGLGVVFRNASLIGPDENREKCDGVAGLVPAQYKSLPDAHTAIAAFKAARLAAVAVVPAHNQRPVSAPPSPVVPPVAPPAFTLPAVPVPGSVPPALTVGEQPIVPPLNPTVG